MWQGIKMSDVLDALSIRPGRLEQDIEAIHELDAHLNGQRFYQRLGFCERAIMPNYLGSQNHMVWLDFMLVEEESP